ncbi:MAG: Fe-S cluster assembly iron-binding protein IscA, partial [Gammaproteobacteria bacterium]
MTENTSIEASPIVFTNNAANKARQLMASKALNAPTDDAVALRVFIQGGGCS